MDKNREMTNEEKIEICRRIATEVMGEPEPPPPPENVIVGLGWGDAVVSDGHVSAGGNWRAVRIWDHGDVPEWTPVRFTKDIDHATRAFDTYFGSNAVLLTERYISHTTGHLEWMAYWGMKYGHGENLPLAICDLVVAHLDDRDDMAWERWDEEEDYDRATSEFGSSSYVFRRGYKNEGMRKAIQDELERDREKEFIVGITVVRRNNLR